MKRRNEIPGEAFYLIAVPLFVELFCFFQEIQICHREAREYTSMYLRRKEVQLLFIHDTRTFFWYPTLLVT